MHRQMAVMGVPTWLDGTVLKQYDPVMETGVYLNVESWTGRISFQERCTILYEAKQLASF